MGNIGPMRQRFDVLALPPPHLGNLDLLTVVPRPAVAPAPESVPQPTPELGPDSRAG